MQPARKLEASSPPQRTYAGDYLLEVQYCSRAGLRVRCQLLITNTSGDGVFHLHAQWGDLSSRIFDEDGNEYIANTARLGTRESTGWAANSLIKEVPMSATLIFENVSAQEQIAALIVGCWDGRHDYTLKIQPVPQIK
jgi:hypothetical protein